MPETQTGAVLPEEVQRLVYLLHRMTAEGKLKWEVGNANTEFILLRPKGSVVVLSEDEDGQHPYTLRVLDPHGVEVESYESMIFTPTEQEGIVAGQPAPWADDFERLYTAARRSTMASTRVVTDLVEALAEEDMPF